MRIFPRKGQKPASQKRRMGRPRFSKQSRTERQTISPELQERLRQVKLFLCDVDGVLTDGTIILGDGKEHKAFSILDGLGLLLLKRHGIKVGWISNRPSEVTRQRAEELRIDFLHQEKGSKVSVVEGILAQTGCAWENVCYLGDDIVDLGVLRRVGVAVAVANAIEEAKEQADYVTRAEGGHGAAREAVRLILEAQGRWEGIIAEHSA